MPEWDWEGPQSEQSAVLAYLEQVADRFDLRRDIQFETWVQDARYDEARVGKGLSESALPL